MPSPTILSDIKIGDVLTALSILLSLIALLSALAQERALRRRDQADKIRNAAAKTLTKLERWQELNNWFFHYIEPIFVNVSEKLANEQDIVAARDFLWKELSAAHI